MSTAALEPKMPPVPSDPRLASLEFSRAFEMLEQAIKKGVNKLDPVSQGRLDEMLANVRQNPPRTATVVNINPWPLNITGNRLLQGITVPACPPGARFAHTHIRGYRRDWKYAEDGTLEFMVITPIKLAGEFVFGFSQNDYSRDNGVGGGVLIYEGENHPDKVGEVETYDAMGRLVTRDQHGIEYEGEQPVPVIHKIPVKRDFQELLSKAIEDRNRYFFARVRKTAADYEDEKKRPLLSLELPLLMGQVLHAEGLLPEPPRWALPNRLEQGLRDDNCHCGAPRKVDALWCSECNHPFEPVECYQVGHITWEQLEMHPLTADEWEQAFTIKAEKEGAKEEALKRIADKQKAAAKTKGKSD